MKKRYYVLIYLILALIALWIFYFSGWNQIAINLIIINIIIYVVRKPVNILSASLFKRRLYRATTSIIVNIIWSAFLLWLLLEISVELFIAIVSFMIVAISLNLRNIINNLVSGILLLTTEQFEIGDLIETNAIQGIVKEITLNYLRIREFDGIDIILPNSNVYGSTITKFTHGKFKIFKPMKKEEFEKRRYYGRYVKTISKILSAKIKTTKYIKQVEILGSIDPEKLNEYFSKVSDKYEPIFGIRPNYSIDKTRFGRVRINLYIMSEKPMLVVQFIDAFLRDLVYELYPDDVFLGWDEYKKKFQLENKSKKKEVKK